MLERILVGHLNPCVSPTPPRGESESENVERHLTSSIGFDVLGVLLTCCSVDWSCI